MTDMLHLWTPRTVAGLMIAAVVLGVGAYGVITGTVPFADLVGAAADVALPE